MYKGLTQVEAAKQLGVARQTYLDLEGGKTLPKIDILINCCEVFNRPLDYFLPDSEETAHKKPMMLIPLETWEALRSLNLEIGSVLGTRYVEENEEEAA